MLKNSDVIGKIKEFELSQVRMQATLDTAKNEVMNQQTSELEQIVNAPTHTEAIALASDKGVINVSKLFCLQANFEINSPQSPSQESYDKQVELYRQNNIAEIAAENSSSVRHDPSIPPPILTSDEIAKISLAREVSLDNIMKMVEIQVRRDCTDLSSLQYQISQAKEEQYLCHINELKKKMAVLRLSEMTAVRHRNKTRASEIEKLSTEDREDFAKRARKSSSTAKIKSQAKKDAEKAYTRDQKRIKEFLDQARKNPDKREALIEGCIQFYGENIDRDGCEYYVEHGEFK